MLSLLLSLSLPITLFCLSPPLPLFILLAVQQAPEPRGKSCSQGNGNSPQSWYQNSLKCELSDSSQWAQRRAKHFQIPLPAECKQRRGAGRERGRASEWTCYVRGGQLGLVGRDLVFQVKIRVLFFLKKSRVCRWRLSMGKYFVGARTLTWTRRQQSYFFFMSKINNSEKTLLYFSLDGIKNCLVWFRRCWPYNCNVISNPLIGCLLSTTCPSNQIKVPPPPFYQHTNQLFHFIKTDW